MSDEIDKQILLSEFQVFPWTVNFETGHQEIDKQHRKLFSLINELAISLTRGEVADLNQTFDKLVQYANFHFKYEESVWAEYFNEDPWFHKHHLKHDSFLPAVSALQNDNRDKPLTEMTEDILQFLIGWLVHHIIDDDKRLAIGVKAIRQGHSIEQAKAIANKEMHESLLELFQAGMQMYQNVSSQSLDLLRERNSRAKVETELRQANKKLAELSITDQLTGLFNRRHFDHVIKTELQRANRDKTHLAMILFDIDYFKCLNDHYGHTAGDNALKKIGQRLREVCRRSGDFSFRIGGEEFVIVTTDQNNENGLEYGEMIRGHIETMQIPNINSKVSAYLTVSVGVVVADPKIGYNPAELMKILDRRLYSAKDLGRNQVVAV
ncbi:MULTISPECIES: GGDEF domain-containing protein [unclassified Neptuniibacter]|uniref:GGDEF domain-containing protein n=1 Tax=unclassified Neptuniibacter TaxID=2630693 RepID=UPI000C4D5178|nr:MULTISPECIES: GGDEF domain-containing protein [unclassified Neptuniibacter]MAY41540.1 GGDEF domain-containing protein [Oceanospirillaceae bacterium]|tara:strand:+ start:9525 stop:10664 length:1140 start_codon:yes stop_codon:yes gene_type:complete